MTKLLLRAYRVSPPALHRSIRLGVVASWLSLACSPIAMAKDNRPVPAQAPSTSPKLSSAYLNLQKCENLYQAPKNLPEGADEPIECKGPGGYLGIESYSAITTMHMVSHTKADFSITLAPKGGPAWTAAPVMEFRLCDGRPFAVIQRIGICDAEENDGTCNDGKSARNVLVIAGLIGMDGRHAEIPAGKQANDLARQAADAWVAESGCPAPPSPRGKK